MRNSLVSKSRLLMYIVIIIISCSIATADREGPYNNYGPGEMYGQPGQMGYGNQGVYGYAGSAYGPPTGMYGQAGYPGHGLYGVPDPHFVGSFRSSFKHDAQVNTWDTYLAAGLPFEYVNTNVSLTVSRDGSKTYRLVQIYGNDVLINVSCSLGKATTTSIDGLNANVLVVPQRRHNLMITVTLEEFPTYPTSSTSQPVTGNVITIRGARQVGPWSSISVILDFENRNAFNELMSVSTPNGIVRSARHYRRV